MIQHPILSVMLILVGIFSALMAPITVRLRYPFEPSPIVLPLARKLMRGMLNVALGCEFILIGIIMFRLPAHSDALYPLVFTCAGVGAISGFGSMFWYFADVMRWVSRQHPEQQQ